MPLIRIVRLVVRLSLALCEAAYATCGAHELALNAQAVDGFASADRKEFSVGTATFIQYTINRDDTPSLTFYISRPKHSAPLLLYIQGSGCSPAFYDMDGSKVSTVFSLLPTAQLATFAVMVIEKPYSLTKPSASSGTATDCSPAFNNYFSFSSWSRDIRQAVDFAEKLPWVDSGKMNVLGFSEGAVMAANLAGSDAAITSVAMLGSTGPTQFFDFIVEAYRSSKSDEEILEKIDKLEAIRKDILAHPEDSTKFVWGHPYKRWSSFLPISVDRCLLESHARMYLVSGMGDESVPILSTEALYAELTAAGKNVLMHRIPEATHSLLPAGVIDYNQLDREITRIRNWFEAD